MADESLYAGGNKPNKEQQTVRNALGPHGSDPSELNQRRTINIHLSWDHLPSNG
jgi:hypothetical protein